MKAMNQLISKKQNRVVLFLIYDVMVLIISSYLAINLRFDFTIIPITYSKNLYSLLYLDIPILILVFTFFRLYTSSWKYASITELVGVVDAIAILEITMYVYKNLLKLGVMPRSYFIIQFLLLIILVGALRFSYRLYCYAMIRLEKAEGKINTMIIGAGDAGRLLITEIHSNEKFNNKVKCFIDDNKEKRNTYLKGIPVVGNRKKIEDACLKYNIEEIIIAIPSAEKSEIAQIVEECQKTKCKIKILPALSTMVNGNLMKNVKDLSYEDFLGRDQIIIDIKEIVNSLKDKTVMVTGGGGSIGSELCRQIAKCNPKLLVIYDIYENNAYDIEQELIRTYGSSLNLKTIIGSVRDYDRLEKVFQTYHFDTIFHAAAHKHVPLMEESPNEAIKNNCLGTLNVAKLCDMYKVSKMVLISTDKAVRPTNIMGASKRICEMIIQSLNKEAKYTDYVAVRFGNVLGSNGSVIPLFLKQIEKGGPVTVTHKEITRFFMTIPEAVSLVLQASVYAEGGEIFVLDMGKPVKIYDLAKQLIKYKGYEPDVDIKIEITGLRPGEKLYEEILMDEEGLKETPNRLIHIGKPIKMNEKKFLKDLDSLIMAAYLNSDDIKEKVAKIVPTYTVDKREKE